MANKTDTSTIDETSSAIGAVAAAISSVGDEFESIKYKIEGMGEAIDRLGSFSELAEVIALSTIATNGTDEDREEVVERLKRSYLRG